MSISRTWEGELEELDLYKTEIQEQIEEIEVPVHIEMDERYTVLPGHHGPRLFCTTCRMFVRSTDMDIQLKALVLAAQEHEVVSHNGR
jgi:hypothetical protein